MFKKILEYSGLVALVVLVLVIAFSGHAPKLGNSTASYQEADGGYYVGAQQFVVPTGLTAGSFPTILAGDLIQGLGAPLIITTSTTLTPTQFCNGTLFEVVGTAGNITVTLPSVASTTATTGACPSGGSGWTTQLVMNLSANTLAFAGGTGMTFQVPVGASTTPATAFTLAAGKSASFLGVSLSNVSTTLLEIPFN
jgi:hypothetical protein